jgi:CRP-like cAMP-binding protein
MSAVASASISHHAFFAGLPQAFAERLASLATPRELRIGELLFRHGDRADAFFLIEHGLVSIELYAPGRDPVVVEQVGEGDVAGWSWLVPPYLWTFDARAVEHARLIEIDAAALRRRFESEPELGYEVVRRFIPVMARRMASARERLVECAIDRP